MEPPSTPRRRPISMHYPPPSPSSYSLSSHRPTSPPPPAQPPRLTRRPTHQKHKSTSSLSSLAQLNLGGSFGGSSGRQTPPPSLGPSSSIPHSPSILHSPRWEEGTWGLQRSNSISAAAGGQWGAFGVGSSAAVGVGREYEDVQNRTFCKWLNARLEPHGYPPVIDLGVDFSDGTRLIQLVEVLTESSLGRYNQQPYHRVQKMENAVKALERIKEMGVHLTNIGPEDVVDGNRKLILGMIWSLVLRFSIANINEEGSHAKEGLLLWCQRKTAPYDEVDVKDFTRSWQDGLAFCALIHRHRPDLLDYDQLDKRQRSAAHNLAKAFKVAEEHLGIPQLLDVEDVCGTKRPDERSIMTYVAQFFHAFSSRAQAETEARVIGNFVQEMSALMLAVHDYERRVTELLSAIDSHLSNWSTSPPSPSHSYAQLFAHRASFATYQQTLRRTWLKEKSDTRELLANLRNKLRTYGLKGYEPEEGLRVEDVVAKWDELGAVELERSRTINLMIRRIQEEARTRFADQANALQVALRRVQGQMAALSDPSDSLTTQLDSFHHLSTAILPSLAQSLDAVRDAENACRECEALDSGVDGTCSTTDELGVELECVKDAVKKRIAFIENQMVARKASSVTPEQLEDFESAFRAFDKDGNNALDLDELAGALSSMGVLEVNLDGVKQVDGLVSFEEYIRLMSERAEDRVTGDKVRSCFRSIAADKGFITELDLTRLQLPSSAMRFLRDHMAKTAIVSEVESNGADALQGRAAFDYEAFLNNFLE
ncbi:actin cross-linking [Rhodotorula toruloides]|uniref:Actin cross-linking n=1 Tax=Rhodotorula toruloides TaxID=5286 RepID=A0A511KL36_RHOTO|nr:actin cross-linking [Rhodotorula toruloides]